MLACTRQQYRRLIRVDAAGSPAVIYATHLSQMRRDARVRQHGKMNTQLVCRNWGCPVRHLGFDQKWIFEN